MTEFEEKLLVVLGSIDETLQDIDEQLANGLCVTNVPADEDEDEDDDMSEFE